MSLLNEELVKMISKLKNEPNWMLEFRLNSLSNFFIQKNPNFGPELDIDFNKWSEQLSDISKTIEEKFGAILEDEGFWNSVKNFFVNLMETISSWFGGSDKPETE